MVCVCYIYIFGLNTLQIYSSAYVTYISLVLIRYKRRKGREIYSWSEYVTISWSAYVTNIFLVCIRYKYILGLHMLHLYSWSAYVTFIFLVCIRYKYILGLNMLH